MTLKTLLVPIEDERHAPALLDTAAALALVFDSYVEGIDAWPAQHAALLAADQASVAALPKAGLQAGHRARQLRANFERTMEARGLARSPTMGGPRTFGWREAEPAEDAAIASYARLFDATVLARPQADGTSPRVSLVETVLFESGRPILIAPPRSQKSFGRHVMIAWNRSAESARAVAFAMPLLRKAGEVTVLTVAGGVFPGPDGVDLARHLVANGVPAKADTVPGDRLTAGGIFLAEAVRRGCDLIVKGAYTRSRLRQMMFGGATSQILWQAEIPVLLAH